MDQLMPIPEGYRLRQNYPNPFNPSTTVEYGVPGDCQVTLKVYNLKGQLVRTLVNEYKLAGTYTATWDGRNEEGQRVASGTYLCKITAGGFSSTTKMVLVR